MSAVYAVRVGRAPGKYRSWPDCNAQVHRFPGAQFEKFRTEAEADVYLAQPPGPPPAAEREAAVARALDRLAVARGAGRAVVYVDGSNTADGQLMSFGLTCEVGDATTFESSGVTVPSACPGSRMRNVYGELCGALEALNLLEGGPELVTRPQDPPRYPDIVLVHDYRGISRWAKGLDQAKNPWVREVYVRLMRAYDDRIDYLWVPGHSGVPGNDRADRLAKDAIADHLAVYGPPSPTR